MVSLYPRYLIYSGVIGIGLITGLCWRLVVVRKKVKRKSFVSRDIPVALLSSEYSLELVEAIKVSLKAGEKILEALNDSFAAKSVSNKGSIDFVTQTDKDNEKLIFDSLKCSFPNHQFIGEVY